VEMGEIAQETERGRSYNIQKAVECLSKNSQIYM